jgi:hypothetical protein
MLICNRHGDVDATAWPDPDVQQNQSFPRLNPSQGAMVVPKWNHNTIFRVSTRDGRETILAK